MRASLHQAAAAVAAACLSVGVVATDAFSQAPTVELGYASYRGSYNASTGLNTWKR
jgi:hypothetical protein